MASEKHDNKVYEKQQPCCVFCGATVGDKSERTYNIVSVIYDCPKCCMNYCNQCSYEKEVNGSMFQMCLRCNSKLEKIT